MGHTLRKISPKPMRKDWEDIAENFEKQAHFPMCIGAIDGKHIHVENFPHEGSMCYNYKKYFSFVLLAIADSIISLYMSILEPTERAAILLYYRTHLFGNYSLKEN